MTRNRISDEEMARRKSAVMESKLVLSGERFLVADICSMFSIKRPSAQSLVSAMIKDHLITKIELPSGKRAYMVKRPSIISKCWRQMNRERAEQ
jgi:hypothetical protein